MRMPARTATANGPSSDIGLHTWTPVVTPCPDPAGCPVIDPDRLAAAPRHTLRADTVWGRCYDNTWGYDEPNPGHGDTRFAPFRDAMGVFVSTMYLAENAVGALLETLFHDTLPGGVIFDAMLRGRLLTYLAPPSDLLMIDLRDPALDDLGIPRSSIASSSAEHYPCTRHVARSLYAADTAVHGIVWHSRQAEFHRSAGRPVPESEVAIVFTDRISDRRGSWARRDLQTVSLGSGEGRTLVDEVAEVLDVTTITA